MSFSAIILTYHKSSYKSRCVFISHIQYIVYLCLIVSWHVIANIICHLVPIIKCLLTMYHMSVCVVLGYHIMSPGVFNQMSHHVTSFMSLTRWRHKARHDNLVSIASHESIQLTLVFHCFMLAFPSCVVSLQYCIPLSFSFSVVFKTFHNNLAGVKTYNS